MTYGYPLLNTEDTANDLLSDVHVLANLIGRAFSGQLDDLFGISVPEWRVVLTLARHPGLTAAEITSRWAMDKMAISRAIQRLEADGHIGRDRNPSDRRSYKLSLTASGEALHQKILPTANKRYREFVSCLTREELASLRLSVEKLIAHAGELRD
jgi:DNA-binding MarR family transcriptional regulator